MEHLEGVARGSDLIRMLDGHLEEREATILKMRYGLDGTGIHQSLDVCGRQYGVSFERLSMHSCTK